MKAVIDRFEGNIAVLLVGDKEVKVDFPKILLPKGSKEGSWLFLSIDIDREGTKRQEEKIKGMLDKLKNK